jgi:hypothetical protein
MEYRRRMYIYTILILSALGAPPPVIYRRREDVHHHGVCNGGGRMLDARLFFPPHLFIPALLRGWDKELFRRDA